MNRITQWLIEFFLGDCPIEQNCQNFAPPRPSKEEYMIRAICMDMQMHPSAWTYENLGPGLTEFGKYINKEADIRIDYTHLNTFKKCIVNDEIELGPNAYKRIAQAYDNRNFAKILEKLTDRIANVITITPDEVREAARPELVDPFKIDPITRLSEHMTALEGAARIGRQLPPAPLRIAAPALPQMKPSVYTTSKKLTSKQNKTDLHDHWEAIGNYA